MKRGLTAEEMAARIAARDAEVAERERRRAWIEEDRREELLAITEIALLRKVS